MNRESKSAVSFPDLPQGRSKGHSMKLSLKFKTKQDKIYLNCTRAVLRVARLVRFSIINGNTFLGHG